MRTYPITMDFSKDVPNHGGCDGSGTLAAAPAGGALAVTVTSSATDASANPSFAIHTHAIPPASADRLLAAGRQRPFADPDLEEAGRAADGLPDHETGRGRGGRGRAGADEPVQRRR